MFFVAKRIYVVLSFDVKMNIESVRNDQVLKNLNVMCDVELILGLPYILPLLKCCTHSSKLHKAEMYLCAILLKM
jgi:hypothetical protein